ncbi:MAG: DNA polymerase III subunit alpha, partial [Ferruginibacter sp.]
KLPVEAECGKDESFVAPGELLEAFRNYPGIVTNTYKLTEACNIEMEFHTDKNKKIFSGSPADDKSLLAKLAKDGHAFRYGNNKPARIRVEKELAIIDQLGFNAYFLITWDLIRYAQSRGFYHVGRGSGANSIVAFCLQITDVDPIELDLYFERFLNPYRTSPPDFDIDFSWLDRDEVIDYVFKRYGKKQVALLGMYSTFQYRAVVRELGKVFGLPKAELDHLAAGGSADDKIHQMILQYGKLIENFPNHLSIHPGGMLISEEPVTNYATLFMPPKGFPTVQLDMFAAENIGLYKLDVLSQRGLGHIKESLRLIKQNQQVDVNIHEIEKFKKDKLVSEQIRNVNTIGCFYIESPAMRQLLKKLECDNYITLVAASSIIRPGVASSGMMKAYIERYHDHANIDYIHPVMKELLAETFGVMVFQEDVIKVAHHFAGLDMGEADILRRAMSGKYRGNQEMLRIREKFSANCKERGYPDAITAEVWRQIESFGGYSFSKAHSASFAVESYQSLFLKTYYPKEFMVAVINNFGGFYNRELYFLELRKTGAAIHLPCVNESGYYTNIKGNDVYTGFIHIKSLQQEMAEKILEKRNQSGAYLHLHDFIERTDITKEQLNILVSIGAFRFTGKSKKQLLWEANFLQKKNKTHIPSARSLFKEKAVNFALPVLTDNRIDDLYDEMELLDFPLCNPFEMVDDDPHKYLFSKDLARNLGASVKVLVYFIDYKVVPTVRNEAMSFGTFLDVNLDWVDTVHFPDSLRQYPLKGRGFYLITGKVVRDFGVYSLEVSKMIKVGYKERKYANL